MSTPHLEKEYKVLINARQYEEITSQLSISPILQINHYYDTSLQNCAARIREEQDGIFFTLKIKNGEFHDEYEFSLSEVDIEDDKVKSLLTELSIHSLTYLGDLKNLRYVLPKDKGEICIDKSTYFGHTDFELEYELYDPSYQDEEFIAFLQENRIPYIRNFSGKFARFLRKKAEKERYDVLK